MVDLRFKTRIRLDGGLIGVEASACIVKCASGRGHLDGVFRIPISRGVAPV